MVVAAPKLNSLDMRSTPILAQAAQLVAGQPPRVQVIGYRARRPPRPRRCAWLVSLCFVSVTPSSSQSSLWHARSADHHYDRRHRDRHHLVFSASLVDVANMPTPQCRASSAHRIVGSVRSGHGHRTCRALERHARQAPVGRLPHKPARASAAGPPTTAAMVLGEAIGPPASARAITPTVRYRAMGCRRGVMPATGKL